MYGVSCVPEVAEYDLKEFHSGASGNEWDAACLLVCTDGVWDNWKYPDIIKEAMRPEVVQLAVESGSGQVSG